MRTISRRAFKDRKYLKSIIQLLKRIGVLPKYLKDPQIKIYKKILVFASMVYVLSPIDIISDPIFGFGLIDDAMIVMYLISKISDELDNYLVKDKVLFNKKKIVNDVEYKIDDE
ncbi:DUF1232 domain-containing protein [Clostridiaceae bacterium 35-E11]